MRRLLLVLLLSSLLPGVLAAATVFPLVEPSLGKMNVQTATIAADSDGFLLAWLPLGGGTIRTQRLDGSGAAVSESKAVGLSATGYSSLRLLPRTGGFDLFVFRDGAPVTWHELSAGGDFVTTHAQRVVPGREDPRDGGRKERRSRHRRGW